MICIWLDDYLKVVICCIFTNKLLYGITWHCCIHTVQQASHCWWLHRSCAHDFETMWRGLSKNLNNSVADQLWPISVPGRGNSFFFFSKLFCLDIHTIFFSCEFRRKQACKPQSYASTKLQLTNLPNYD